MHKYPKVNYIGNKEKLVQWIISEMPVKSGKVLDIFSGGCSVSYALKDAGYEVIANDILYADYIIAKALLSNDTKPISEKIFFTKINTRRVNSIRKKISFLEETLYYPEEVDELAKLLAISEKLDENQQYLFLALVRRAMIRKLPYSRMNVPWNQIQQLRDEEYSYRKYKRKRAYHNQSFESHIIENMEAYNNALFQGKKCEIHNVDAMKIAKKISNVDIIYMDPPYPSTMNNYDAFYGSFDKMFSKKVDHMDFTNKSTFLKNLEKLIKTLKDKTKYIVLSQNTRVQPSPKEIMKMLSKYGEVELKEKKHNYQVTGKDNKNSSKELLFILKIL